VADETAGGSDLEPTASRALIRAGSGILNRGVEWIVRARSA
jgi:hypothetical protein